MSRQPSFRNNPTPPPIRPHPLAPYHPSSDTATYRDLLLFEERLKSNAEMLRRRRQRYSIFLWSFVTALFTMGYRLLVQPPRNMFKLRALQASVAVVFITLALFFASGMYQEKIRYAHSYINHSNKALRPLNMHLNMRRPPPAILSYIPFVSSSSKPAAASATSIPEPAAQPNSKPFLGGKGPASTSSARKVSGTPNVMATIPPSSNPRGELIFSSRVDRAFREGYERYRAAFERRREEKAREEARRSNKSWFWRIRKGRSDSPSPGPTGSKAFGGLLTPTPTNTPPMSRRDTPELVPTSHSIGNRRTPSPSASGLRHSVTSSVSSAHRPAIVSTGGSSDGRERSESYSFVLDNKQPGASLGPVPARRG